jgi:SagB-type dehydrogenase family enzyme
MKLESDMRSVHTTKKAAEPEYSFVELFHEYTKLNRENIVHLAQRREQIAANPNLVKMMACSWKSYEGLELVWLPPPELGEASLEQLLQSRCWSTAASNFHFSGRPIELHHLGTALAFSYGIMPGRHRTDHPAAESFRAVPSASALYSLEIYVIAFNIDGLSEGVYHYRVMDHSLDILRKGSLRKEFMAILPHGELCEKASVALVITSIFRRNLMRNMNRGYRLILNEAGAVMQNLHLTGAALGFAIRPLEEFYDDELGSLIGIDNVDEACVSACLAGGN